MGSDEPLKVETQEEIKKVTVEEGFSVARLALNMKGTCDQLHRQLLEAESQQGTQGPLSYHPMEINSAITRER